ncbi:caspase Dronc-like isoform X2 [Epargyreus clarus]
MLYRDLTRRGPQAFEHLLESLTEVGKWDLVRELDPNSALHYSRSPRNPPRNPSSSNKGSSRSHENNYVSISEEKKRTKTEKEINESAISAPSRLPVVPSEIPHFHIVKSTKFHEDDGDEFKLYRTRSRPRGVLLMFSYTEFLDETFRRGADVDCRHLKYLFDEFGFKVLGYNNLTQQATLDTLKSLRQVEDVHAAECVFVVVSSHGHERAGLSDVDVCCYDGRVSVYDFIDFFNNTNFPELQGKPKVFIFQICRGLKENYSSRAKHRERDGAGDQADADELEGVEDQAGVEEHLSAGEKGDAREREEIERDGAPRGADRPVVDPGRDVSDILIAYSTVPGFVSYRDPEKGSWYIQALCEVFAARAHERHVHDLLTLVDQRLATTFPGQTSSYENWGFNRRLYLHPGLYDDEPAAAPRT